MADYVIERTELPHHPLLGRNVHHDSRSRAYAYRPRQAPALTSVMHELRIPVLDQGNTGSCTGNATVHALGSDPFFDTLINIMTDVSEDQALRIYSEATALDGFPGQYPPEDTGSDGLSAAKAAQRFGYISGYLHAFSLDDTLAALQARPLITGITWYNSMFEPGTDGSVYLDRSSGVAGGHEICLDELDLRKHRVGFQNSWGTGWGKAGRFYLDVDDFGSLLKEDGDVTVFVPLTAPVPTPSPVPDKPVTPAPLPTELEALVNGTKTWRHSSIGRGAAGAKSALKNYLVQQGIID